MATSKRDYVAIAEIVERVRSEHWNQAAGVLAEVAHQLADYFAQDNPRFDSERFLTACGIE